MTEGEPPTGGGPSGIGGATRSISWIRRSCQPPVPSSVKLSAEIGANSKARKSPVRRTPRLTSIPWSRRLGASLKGGTSANRGASGAQFRECDSDAVVRAGWERDKLSVSIEAPPNLQ